MGVEVCPIDFLRKLINDVRVVLIEFIRQEFFVATRLVLGISNLDSRNFLLFTTEYGVYDLPVFLASSPQSRSCLS